MFGGNMHAYLLWQRCHKQATCPRCNLTSFIQTGSEPAWRERLDSQRFYHYICVDDLKVSICDKSLSLQGSGEKITTRAEVIAQTELSRLDYSHIRRINQNATQHSKRLQKHFLCHQMHQIQSHDLIVQPFFLFCLTLWSIFYWTERALKIVTICCNSRHWEGSSSFGPWSTEEKHR